ncbi:hypothetical protein RHMOL_Rhmol13G0295200 [Rhododendron molle]|uniref:Uncharacterized protein n=1 Tax=Rhododendron molle TaxID=49168 RepID=A0ACC0LD00_RHOML|nr:hypothetical protein RHMOL_Rhmol13G0295200 [Rhododendron molle]
MTNPPPQIAIIGAGTFVKTQYLPRLAEITDLVVVKAIWSRSEESARGAVEIGRKIFPEVECGYVTQAAKGREACPSRLPFELTFVLFWHASNFALANMVDIEEKPAAASTSEAETALSSYNSTFGTLPGQPIWAVAENYRFEPALVEGKKLVAEIGEMMSVQVIAEGSMNSSNPYFSSSWRRNFTGGFVIDMGVHYVAGLRMVSLYTSDGQNKCTFYPFSGVTEEFKAFINDFSQATQKKGKSFEPEPRCSFVEGARDVAVLEAMLESGMREGALVQVKRF